MNKPEIFLSYAHKNKEIVERLHDILTKKYKFSVWFDKNNIELSQQIDEVIYDGIVNSKLVICCFSQAYLDSEMCIREFKLANHKKKTCLALMIEKVDIDGNSKTGFYSIGMLRCNIYKNKEEKPPIDLLDGERFDDLIKNIKTRLGKDAKKDESLNDAYLSYDFEFARRSNRLAENLRNHGFNIYREYLRMGIVDKDFETTKNAIDSSRIFICCGTKSYSRNDICLREIDYADARRKPKLVLMFEDHKKEELKHLADLMDDANIVKMYKDEKNDYEEGIGEKFNETVTVLRSLLGKEKVEKPKEKIHNLWISFTDKDRALVEDFAKRLSKERGIEASYDSNPNKSVPNYDAIEQSKIVLAIMTPASLKTNECLEEASFANRNSISVTYVVDNNLKIEDNNDLRQLLEESLSKNTHRDLAILKKPISQNEIAISIENNLGLVSVSRAQKSAKVLPNEVSVKTLRLNEDKKDYDHYVKQKKK